MDHQDEPQTSQPQSNNQKLIVGLIVGILIGLVIAFYLLGYFPFISTAIINVLIALFVLSVIAILTFTWFKNRILAHLFGKDFQVESSKVELKNLYDQIGQEYVGKLLEDFPKDTQNKAKLATPRILKLVVWAFTRSWALRLIVAIFVAIGGLLGAILLYNQNQLLINQNEKIDIQNQRLNFQNNLIEADRRSSLVFLMSNVLDKVDEEFKEQRITKKDNLGDSKFSLSKPLMSRIVALSRAFRPYQMLEGDTLSVQLVSPERGQLFIALMENQLDSVTQNAIIADGNFSNAIIGEIQLHNAKFNGANLSGADLRGAYLGSANFGISSLSVLDVMKLDLSGANSNTDDLHVADLSRADLSRAYLSGANFHLANLNSANFSYANLSGADLHSANLHNANFYDANLKGTYLNDANFEEVRNITSEQLKEAYSLYKCKNLDPELEEKLRSEKPCLFTEKGCKG